ncbi:hypothetical protein, conserved [Trypanosoma brucei brucei TREU927]|uniref:Uncharacterized protein n=1 Tax=Trypanosoma brucei brucei (strain 927/4 GUTat10.1) TaxID=185431 RepID=Q382B8_TRYB2|nr:hypothetical protein, conserved [Trypanosoma brucei brucei TREU927]EAN80363.1 hypothetical protein, conserved [Trypanosoma brucei brucei TREU927]
MSFLVYAVDGADRLTLLGPPTPEGPNLKQVALSYIQAPKVAKRNATGEFGSEDPCAFEAVELIRNTFIGKPVKFSEDYVIDVLQRRAGRLTLVDGEDASILLLRNGLATVPERIPQRMDKELFAKYTKLMSEAKAAKKGIFAPSASSRVRTLTDLSPEEKIKLAEKLKGKEALVRLEHVLLPTVLVVSGGDFGDAQVTVHMPGVTVKDPDCETVSRESRYHVERFLLHRRVKILFEGADGYGNILGSVTSSKGCFQQELLSRGLVKLNGNTLGSTKFAADMETAEKEAREKCVGMWKNRGESGARVPLKVVGGAGVSTAAATGGSSALPVSNAATAATVVYKGPTQFTASIVQIITGDTLGVRHEESGELIRVSLAGVRSSKNITREQDGRSPETRVTYGDYEWEAREFLRVHFAGKRVTVKVEYCRQIAETGEVRPVALITVLETGENVGSALLETGYVNFFLGRNDICSAAAELQCASERAEAKGVGVHGKAPAPVVKVLELVHLGSARGKYYLSFLQRGMQGNRPPVLKGIVDVVIGGSSLRVFVPREHFQIPVKVAGIITPMGAAGGSSEGGEPFAEESKRFAVDKLQHMEVGIQVHAADKVGNFISSVTLPDGTNFAVAMVEMGFATVANADRLPHNQQLLEAEAKAKAEKRNIWSNNSSVPQRAAKLEAQKIRTGPIRYTSSSGPKAEFQQYMLSEVGENGYSVYLQEATEDVEKKLFTMQDLLGQISSSSTEYKPKKGELVAALYKTDKTWNRAKVVQVSKKDPTVTVCFVDFGTKSEIRLKDVRAIPRGPEFAIARDSAPLARLVRLAFLKSKIHTEAYIDYACDIAYEYTDGPVVAKEVYQDPEGNVYCIVSTSENSNSLNEVLLQRGAAVLDRAAESVDPEGHKRHVTAQNVARKGHKGMWQYGDIDNESDEDN